MMPGLRIPECSVKAWPDGRLMIKGTPRDAGCAGELGGGAAERRRSPEAALRAAFGEKIWCLGSSCLARDEGSPVPG
jgi:hypothetical protein